MGHKIAIDFGTTNTVLAHWQESAQSAEVLALPGLSAARPDGSNGAVPLVPSLLYVHNGLRRSVSVGQAVHDARLDRAKGNRLFRSFKRGIATLPAPAPREIDGTLWGDREAGRVFLEALLEALPFDRSAIEQLVLTVPVTAFEHYLDWLTYSMDGAGAEQVRIVDESTAAALGYAITDPGALVLIFDFGGGTLDLALVRLPESRDNVGGLLQALRRGQAADNTARVIAKAGRTIGGSDIDQWILAEVLRRADLTLADLGDDHAPLLTACEEAKIALSGAESAEIAFEAGGESYIITLTRAELEKLMDDNGFYAMLRHMADKAMHVAHREGIFEEDVEHVLLVGGISLMPSVQRTLRQYFRGAAVRAHKPFTAVAEGALQVAVGMGLEDYLINSYGLRHLDPATGTHQYDEIIPMGSRYPTPVPYEVTMGAAHADQEAIEFVIGMIDPQAASRIEVQHIDGQPVFVARADPDTLRVMALNEFAPPITVTLSPPGQPGEDRIRAAFSVDSERRLRVSVTDLKTRKVLLHDAVIVTLR